ncbi:hypothetical protein K493DRAFT_339622 [Basidiobolus meristosporus CBS 931.73]|uniref:Uncharacterized protein n=1 Tax=Basidiobolus meristosporus CBS 931.73 TaxID=1314790 RepID=A0A1Y1XZ33_9FUNG|nr:hypothetical protein K493DRAFT_339622 [Basidiobolus meristosporus CBS 931.73]|eukprot:ORX91017.1 hypothetical protein K493DRAFT_339622 [Basidiobolus meristosporus CBS 931.73]
MDSSDSPLPDSPSTTIHPLEVCQQNDEHDVYDAHGSKSASQHTAGDAPYTHAKLSGPTLYYKGNPDVQYFDSRVLNDFFPSQDFTTADQLFDGNSYKGIFMEANRLLYILYEWALGFDRRMGASFPSYSTLKVLSIWSVVFVADAVIPAAFRIEWGLASLMSAVACFKAYQASSSISLALMLFLLIMDIVIWTVVHPLLDNTALYILADTSFYLSIVSSIRGLDSLSWLICLGIFSVDLYGRSSSPEGGALLVPIHAVSYGVYVLAAEMLCQIMEWKNHRISSSDISVEESYLNQRSRHQFLRINSSHEPDSQSNPIHRAQKYSPLRKPRRIPGSIRQRHSAAPAPIGDPSFLKDPKSGKPSSDSLVRASHGEEIPNSFDLCISRITPVSVTLYWIMPETILHTLGASGKAYGDDHGPAPTRASASGSEEPKEKSTEGSSSGASEGADGPSTTNTSILPIEVSSIKVRVDNMLWQDVHVSVEEANATIQGLNPVTEYEVTITIMGYRSAICRFCTSPSTAIADHHAAATTTEAPIVEPKIETHAEDEKTVGLPDESDRYALYQTLVSELNFEKQQKKEALLSLKKLKRDLQKSEAQLRNEIESLNRSLAKSNAMDVRSKSRIQFLQEHLRQMDAHSKAVVEEIAAVKLEQAEIRDRIVKVGEEANECRQQLKEVEKELQRISNEFAKQLKEIQTKNQKLTATHKEIKAKIQAIQDTEIVSLRNQLSRIEGDIAHALSRRTELAAREDEIFDAEKRTIQTYEADCRLLRQEIAEAEKRVVILRATMEDEIKFVNQLTIECQNLHSVQARSRADSL